MPSAPLSFVRGGELFGGKFYDRGKTVYYWQSQIYSSRSARRISNLSNSYYWKESGYTLRCVVRQEGGGENKE